MLEKADIHEVRRKVKGTAEPTVFRSTGSRIFVSSRLDGDILDRVPPGFYLVNFNQLVGYHLTRTFPFELPERIYGSCPKMATRFLNTFADRPSTTGVLLFGNKGAGKSLLLKLLANLAVDAGYPIFLVDEPYAGSDFNEFIRKFEQPALVLFDEFEKVYHEEDKQEALLTLFDGAFSSKKLMVITSNDKYKIDKNFLNRPGRIFYALEFGGLDEAFVREYLGVNLEDKSKLEAVVRLGAMIFNFSFDMLQAITEELNRYGEDVKDVLDILNITYVSTNAKYRVEVYDPKGMLLGEHGFREDPHGVMEMYEQEDEEGAPKSRKMSDDYFPSEIASPFSGKGDGKWPITVYARDKNGRRTRVRTVLTIDLTQKEGVEMNNDMTEVVVHDKGYRIVLVKIRESHFNYRTWF
jgi:hypothetical protein